jgi:hypothetical protein
MLASTSGRPIFAALDFDPARQARAMLRKFKSMS